MLMRDLGSHGLKERPVGHIGPGGHWEVPVVGEAYHLHDVDQEDGDDKITMMRMMMMIMTTE